MNPTTSQSNRVSKDASSADAAVSQIEQLIDAASDGVQQAAATDAPPSDHTVDQASENSSAKPSAQFKPFHLDQLNDSSASGSTPSIESLAEVELDLRIELGRTQMTLQDVLQLRDGSVVALDTLAGDPVSIFVNERIVARGEILVMDDQFCVRITELVGA